MAGEHLQVICFAVAVNIIATDYWEQVHTAKVARAGFIRLLYPSCYYIVTKTLV